MDDVTLTALVAQLRGHRTDSTFVEAKAARSAVPTSLRETLSSFSNLGGGTILLGLPEEQGFASIGVADAPKVRDDLASLCGVMEPPVRAEIEITDFEGVQLVVAEVEELPTAQKPCFIKDRGPYFGSFTRTGDGNRQLTQYEVGLLISERGQPQEDATPVTEASLDDLDAEAVRVLVSRVRQRQPSAFGGVTDDVVLRRLKVLVGVDDRLVPSLAGLLALGAYPQQFFPQLHVSFINVPARSLDTIPDDGPRFLDNQTLTGSIPKIVSDTMSVIARNMSTRAVVTSEGRRDYYDLPLEALREAVVNALLHRDYSPGALGQQVQIEMYQDRLVIKNAGGLYGSVSEDDLGKEGTSSTRNAFLANLLTDTAQPGSDRVTVENRGSGIPVMLATLRRAGLTTPLFRSRLAGFTVTFPKQSLLDSETLAWLESLGLQLNDQQRMALALMREGREVANSSLQQLGIDSREATATLRSLVDLGLAVSSGGRRYANYRLAEPSGAPAPLTFPHVFTSGPHPPSAGQRQTTAILALFEENTVLTAAQISDELSLGRRSVSDRLTTMVSSGLLVATAPPRAPTRAYRLPAPAD